MIRPITLFILLLIGNISCNSSSNSGVKRDASSPLQKLTVEELIESFASSNLNSKSEVRNVLKNAADSAYSVSFIHMAWSLDSAVGQRDFAEFFLEFDLKNPDQEVLFHFIDGTPLTDDYRELSEIPGWIEGGYAVHGYGEMVWMKGGRVVHCEAIRNFSDSDALVAKTTSLFSDGIQ